MEVKDGADSADLNVIVVRHSVESSANAAVVGSTGQVDEIGGGGDVAFHRRDDLSGLSSVSHDGRREWGMRERDSCPRI